MFLLHEALIGCEGVEFNVKKVCDIRKNVLIVWSD